MKKRIWIFPIDFASGESLIQLQERFSASVDPDLKKVINLAGQEEELPLFETPLALMTYIEISIHRGSSLKIRAFHQNGDDGPILEQEVAKHHAPTRKLIARNIKKVQHRR